MRRLYTWYGALCALILLSSGHYSLSHWSDRAHVHRVLHHRKHHLKSIVNLAPSVSTCNSRAFIVITEIPYGNTGNNVIEFTNMLWLSRVYNYTLIVPPWIRPALSPFNLTTLHEKFCFNFDSSAPAGSVILEVTSEDSYFMCKLFYDPMYNATLPAFDSNVIEDLSRHFIIVYSALWASPSHEVINATAWLIENKLSGFNYTTVHKRSLEGGCNKLMSFMMSPSDFSPLQIDMNHNAWKGNLRAYHPVCEMPVSFAKATMAMHNRSSQPIFLAFDGRGNIDDYKAAFATLSSDLDPNIFPPNRERKFVDMFMAINGDFFILNPISTYSFQIYVIRVCLGLESVPTPRVRERGYVTPDHLWISFESIKKAYESFVDKIDHLFTIDVSASSVPSS